MQGFAQLVSERDQGAAWVRVAHVTAVRVIQHREGTGVEHNLVSVLAGGEWFRDPADHPSAADAQRRAEELTGTGSSERLRSRLREAVLVITGRPGP